MEDPMMSSANLFSVADELAEILLYDDQAVVGVRAKPSPGHESVDSGFGLGSPSRSEISECDSEMITFSDLVEQDSAESDLINYLTSTEDENGNSVSGKTKDNSVNEVVEMDCGTNNQVPEGAILSLTDDVFNADLSQLLQNVEKNVAQAPVVPEGRPRRAVRATRGGKSVVMRPEPSKTTPTPRVTKVTKGRPRRRPSFTAVTEALPALPEMAEGEELVEKNQKNAIQARINRQKKKAYIEGLETQVQDLSKENEELRKDTAKSRKEVDSLQREVAYLKSVIVNESALAGMLQNIPNVQGVRFTTSFQTSRKRSPSDLDHDYGVGSNSKKRKPSTTPMSGGVCLHVANQTVSMEFCSQCSTMAQGGCGSGALEEV